jgi:low temperature requirement protein LtrA
MSILEYSRLLLIVGIVTISGGVVLFLGHPQNAGGPLIAVVAVGALALFLAARSRGH